MRQRDVTRATQGCELRDPAMTASPTLWSAFERSGFAIIPNVISADVVADLRVEADRLLFDSDDRGGVRNVLAKSRVLRLLAVAGPPAGLAAQLLGSGARPTKLTIFDKSRRSNWKVPWHQDLTITVVERLEVPDFGPWSIKDGLPHVQPPISILEQIVAIRLHLDDTPQENGALRVLAGTHRGGRLSDTSIAALRDQVPVTTCPVVAGDAMIMSPLLLHASSAAAAATRRRVLHFEFSAVTLPNGLAWA